MLCVNILEPPAAISLFFQESPSKVSCPRPHHAFLQVHHGSASINWARKRMVDVIHGKSDENPDHFSEYPDQYPQNWETFINLHISQTAWLSESSSSFWLESDFS